MTIADFIETTKLDNSLLLGFYGVGNYGDELLLEVLSNVFTRRQVKNVTVGYQNPQNFRTFHHDFGFELVDVHKPMRLIKSILHSRQIVVGGGGLWGMDTNKNIVLMSLMLFVYRWVLGKKVYLLGVGYYDSAPAIGHIAAWLAGKAANLIITRDIESLANFKPIQKHSYRDHDIAWQANTIDPRPYQQDLQQLESKVLIRPKTIFITLRHFREGKGLAMVSAVERTLADNTDKPIIVALLEPKQNDPADFSQLQAWQKQYPNVQTLDFSYNPMALLLLLSKYRNQLVFIGPQFHAILCAHLAGVPYMPLSYDNKVSNLLRQIAPDKKPYLVENIRQLDLQRFIKSRYL